LKNKIENEIRDKCGKNVGLLIEGLESEAINIYKQDPFNLLIKNYSEMTHASK